RYQHPRGDGLPEDAAGRGFDGKRAVGGRSKAVEGTAHSGGGVRPDFNRFLTSASSKSAFTPLWLAGITGATCCARDVAQTVLSQHAKKTGIAVWRIGDRLEPRPRRQVDSLSCESRFKTSHTRHGRHFKPSKTAPSSSGRCFAFDVKSHAS